MSRLYFVAALALGIGAPGTVLAMEGGTMTHGVPQAFASGHPAPAAAASRAVAITMGDMSFSPATLNVKTGEVVRFEITNASTVDHDFTLGDPATQEDHRKEMAEAAGHDGAMHHGDDPNAVMVKAGQSKSLTWVFDKAGTFEYDCNVPGHYESGMSGAVTVSP